MNDQMPVPPPTTGIFRFRIVSSMVPEVPGPDVARLATRFQQVVGALGAQLVGDRELGVEAAEIPQAGQRGHLVHDHVRLRGPDRRDHRLTVQAVDDGGRVLPVTSWPAAIRLGTR
jgi:hypothetical protein